MKNNILFFTTLFLLIPFSGIDAQDMGNGDAYADQINKERAKKDQFFKNAQTSPLVPDSIDSFNGLSYYPPDERFKVTATLTPVDRQDSVTLETSKGNNIKLLHYGNVKFNLDGNQYELMVFRNNNLPEFADDPNQLFIPFRDATNQRETNPTGRYLAVELQPGSNEVTLDFNNSFNPYNAYNKDYEAILPPGQNSLMLSFTSGERKYEDR